MVNKQILIAYSGILPDLFREGQGIVALGRLEQTHAGRPTKYWQGIDWRITCRQEVAQAMEKLIRMKLDAEAGIQILLVARQD